jgi:hypothetical protein
MASLRKNHGRQRMKKYPHHFRLSRQPLVAAVFLRSSVGRGRSIEVSNASLAFLKESGPTTDEQSVDG